MHSSALTQAIAANTAVKKKLPFGAGNLEHKESKNAAKRVTFIRGLRDLVRVEYERSDNESKEIAFPLLRNFFREYKDNGELFPNDSFGGLIDDLLVSIFAKYAKAGNCWEQSVSALMELVLSRFPGRLELIHISSATDFKTHNLIILNRDSSTDASNPASWNPGTIILDPWAGVTMEITISHKISKTDLVKDYIKGTTEDINVVVQSVVERPLNDANYAAIFKFLEALKQFTNNKTEMKAFFEIFRREARWADMNIPKEIENLNKCVTLEIAHFKKLLPKPKPAKTSGFFSFSFMGKKKTTAASTSSPSEPVKEESKEEKKMEAKR